MQTEGFGFKRVVNAVIALIVAILAVIAALRAGEDIGAKKVMKITGPATLR
jgi:hypothetical protein